MILARTRHIAPLDSWDRAFTRLTAAAMAPSAFAWRAAPQLHAQWHGDDLELSVDLPGVPRDALDIQVADRVVTVSVHHATETEELRWSRSIAIGSSLDPESLRATYADGRLRIAVAAAPKPAARRIAIDDAGSALTADAMSADVLETDVLETDVLETDVLETDVLETDAPAIGADDSSEPSAD